MPAAPLVGAVTTCPPAAFSSLTASAQAFTHSIGSTGPLGASASSSRFRRGARRGTLRTPGRIPSAANPRCTQACMTSQMRASRASISASLRIARSLTRIKPSIERPARSHCSRSSSPLANGSGTVCRRAGARGGFRLPFTLHRAAADRVHLLRQQRPPRRIARGEAHAVGMTGQHLVAVEQEVHRFVEGDFALARNPNPAALADPLERRLHHRRVELGRVMPLEAEQDRTVGAMAEPGQCERAIELYEDLGGPGEQALGLEVAHEEARGEHRAHRVRRGRAHADLEHLERGQVHRAASRRRMRSAISSASASRRNPSSCSLASTADSS